MFKFIRDFIKYPFDSNKETNKFSNFLKLILKDYPAFLWFKPTWQRVVVLPLLAISKIFQKR
jgi:hypothetical protein